ncbi:MAG: pilus assembly protein PilM [Firmicutes bacterium]|nr:pilus assembly protein PilM [Bacillota bacterium]
MNKKNQEVLQQSEDTIFVLDIGTRSIIGLAGVVEEDKLNVLAIESAEHTKRAMIDGQIEDINAVAKLASTVKERIEAKLEMKLSRVCVAAAGRALKTERTSHEIEVPDGKSIDEDLINQLESGAIEKIDDMLSESASDTHKQFYLVGYSAIQYYLDDYPISSLLDHHASKIKADVLATFLPSEVVESLYAAMRQAGLEVASLTLEPIAAINAAIPDNLRLLNLAFADIGAGTSDIAVCKDGNIAGYTMTTTAGDEITETLMKEYLIDFDTAEQIKMDLDSKKEIYFTDIMGFEQTLPAESVLDSVSDGIAHLCTEIAESIIDVNGGPPSAVFLAGGGSKLRGVLEGVRSALDMDEKRIAIAGNNFKVTAFSKEYDLNNPEYATPLGIAVSSGLNLINDSYHLTLNGKRARLFRNGDLNVFNVLTMNGYRYRDLFGRSGASLIVTVNGKRRVLYGQPATNSILTLNGQPAKVEDMVKAGDTLEFIPAKAGSPAMAKVSDVLEPGTEEGEVTVNGESVSLDTQLKSGDIIVTGSARQDGQEDETSSQEAAEAAESSDVSETSDTEDTKTPAGTEPEAGEFTGEEKEESLPTPEIQTEEPAAESVSQKADPEELLQPEETAAAKIPADAEQAGPVRKKNQEPEAKAGQAQENPAAARRARARRDRPSMKSVVLDAPPVYEDVRTYNNGKTWHFTLNDKPVTFPAKPDNAPYLLLDMLQHSGLDFDNLTSPVILAVNGAPGIFQQELKENDSIIIRQDE